MCLGVMSKRFRDSGGNYSKPFRQFCYRIYLGMQIAVEWGIFLYFLISSVDFPLPSISSLMWGFSLFILCGDILFISIVWIFFPPSSSIFFSSCPPPLLVLRILPLPSFILVCLLPPKFLICVSPIPLFPSLLVFSLPCSFPIDCLGIFSFLVQFFSSFPFLPFLLLKKWWCNSK